MNQQVQPIAPAPAQQQPPVAPEVVDASANMAFVAEAIAANPSLASDPDVAAYLSANNIQAPNAPAAPIAAPQEQGQPPANPPAANPTVAAEQQLLAEQQAAAAAAQGGASPQQQQAAYESLLFAQKTDAQNAAIVNGTEDIYTHINTKYGMDVKEDFSNWNKFFGSVDKWRTDAQNGSKAQQELAALQTDINNMPKPLYEAMNAWATGQDWQSIAAQATSKIDFNKAFSQNEVADIVNHYYPDEFTKQDLANQQDPNIKKVISLAEKQFSLDKKEHDLRRTRLQQDALTREKSFKDSIESSVSYLKETFPALDQTKLSKVKEIMSSNGEATLFRNADGSYKQEAAKAITLALFGENEITNARKALEERNNQMFNMVGNGADRPAAAMPSGYGSTQGQPAPNQLQEQFGDLFPKTYY